MCLIGQFSRLARCDGQRDLHSIGLAARQRLGELGRLIHRDIRLAVVVALLLNRPAGEYVESVLTLATHLFLFRRPQSSLLWTGRGPDDNAGRFFLGLSRYVFCRLLRQHFHTTTALRIEISAFTRLCSPCNCDFAAAVRATVYFTFLKSHFFAPPPE